MSYTTFSYDGAIVQTFTVETTGTYDITAFGAQGGSSDVVGAGGYGAEMSGDFTLIAGEQLDIIVGGEGHTGAFGLEYGGGGGGGSFVMFNATSLIIAGGGGGSGKAGGAVGGPGLSGTAGATANGLGGSGGAGGGGGGYNFGGGGGGYSGGNGAYYGLAANGSGRGGGYAGGSRYAPGGFGGGGGGGFACGGGGGGYSGGGGGGASAVGGGGGGSVDRGVPLLAISGENAGNGIVTIELVCYLRGTYIQTPTGEVPVERLAVGDAVVTRNGTKHLIWIGTGRAVVTRGQRTAATPVIVRKGAIADNIPNRDLRITKGHSLFIDEVLIPAEFLINHRSILWDDTAREVAVYHLELQDHDVLYANAAPAESYRDDGNRWLFQNGNSGWHLPPREPCAPVLTGGPVVDAIWRRLLDRAGPRDLPPLTDDPDLHLRVDGRRLDPVGTDGIAYVFHLPARPGEVRIVSRDAVPAELGIARDPRALGVAIRRIAITRGAKLAIVDADDDHLSDGFHGYEPNDNLRWTNGDAALPAEFLARFTGTLEVVLTLAGSTRYLDGAVSGNGYDWRQCPASAA